MEQSSGHVFSSLPRHRSQRVTVQVLPRRPERDVVDRRAADRELLRQRNLSRSGMKAPKNDSDLRFSQPRGKVPNWLADTRNVRPAPTAHDLVHQTFRQPKLLGKRRLALPLLPPSSNLTSRLFVSDRMGMPATSGHSSPLASVPGVVIMRAFVQVVRPHAIAPVTLVQRQAKQRLSESESERKAMGSDCLASAIPERPVPMRADVAGPSPTAFGLGDLAPEARFNVHQVAAYYQTDQRASEGFRTGRCASAPAPSSTPSPTSARRWCSASSPSAAPASLSPDRTCAARTHPRRAGRTAGSTSATRSRRLSLPICCVARTHACPVSSRSSRPTHLSQAVGPPQTQRPQARHRRPVQPPIVTKHSSAPSACASPSDCVGSRR